MSCTSYKKKELFVEDVSLRTIAEDFGTPCYIYSAARIKQNWQNFASAFHGMPHRICYAVKANSNIAILHLLASWGAYFDIVSSGELQRVIQAGGDPKHIIFSGVGKQLSEIELAIEHGIFCFNVESEAELERLDLLCAQTKKSVNIALRMNPNIDAETHAYISTGRKENKFGIEKNAIIPIAEKLKNNPHLTFIGIACHLGSQITHLKPYILAIESLIDMYQQLKNIGITMQFLNAGGGFGIVYHQESPPSIQDYADVFKKNLAALPLEIIVEPGRAIVGDAGILLTRVEYLKHQAYKNFAIVDAGMNDLLRPALYHAWQNILPVVDRQDQQQMYDIAGPVCESADILGQDRHLHLIPGDLLAIENAGAYGFSMSSNYNSRCRPPEILVEGNKTHLIRQRETFQDLFALEKIVDLIE
jgi:diaminopimelate decarboxylase